MNNTIHLISLLLANSRANSTFIDYLYEPERANGLLKLIDGCLTKYEEILHRHEKERLFRIWESVHIDVERNNNLIQHLMDNDGMATAHDVNRHIGDTSVFLYIAAIAKVGRNAEIPAELENILCVCLSVSLTNLNRLVIHNLLVEGSLREHSQMEDSVTFTGINGKMIFDAAKHVKTGIEVLDELEIIRMRKIIVAAKSAAGGFGTVVNFHNSLSELALAAQSHNFASALPRFLDAMEPTAAVGAPRMIGARMAGGKFAAGIAGASVISLARTTVNIINAGMLGDARAARTFAVSGAFYAGALALAIFAPKVKIGIFLAIWLGGMSERAARRMIEDGISFVLQNSIWGRDRELRVHDGRLGWWWPLLDNDGNIGGEEREIFISNRRLTNELRDDRDFMQLNVRNRPDVIRETFNRNSHILWLLPQIPPVTVNVSNIDPALSSPHFPHQNHTGIRLAGFFVYQNCGGNAFKSFQWRSLVSSADIYLR